MIKRQTPRWAFSEETLHGKMAFLTGPRQIGKTTLATHHLATLGFPKLSYNWDTPLVKKRFAKDPLFFLQDIPQEKEKAWILFDEIHKYPKWKNYLKGIYDQLKEKVQPIVTGSARLDWFRKSGDSLAGRYFIFKVLPLSIHECLNQIPSPKEGWTPDQPLTNIPQADPRAHEAILSLLTFSGFPEPFTVGTTEFYERWQEQYLSTLLQEDLRDLTKIVHLRKLETLTYLLPERVGAPLSLNALRNPLECSHDSLKTWLEALEKVYLLFSLPTWIHQLSRSILKERKVYFWDWKIVESESFRFENFMAVSLMRAVSAWREWGKGKWELHYLRTKEGQEVDFALTKGNKIYALIEAKQSEKNISPHLIYFKEKLKIPLAIQVIREKQYCSQKAPGLYVMGADRLLSLIP